MPETLDICICTYRRPSLRRTLMSLDRAVIPDDIRCRVVVIDNDDRPSAALIVQQTARHLRLPISYLHEPGANISLARNAGLAKSSADWLAFLDDDEVADRDWLQTLFARQRQTGADAVFGHSIAEYPADTPGWIRRGDFHSQYAQSRDGLVETGHTCNALLRWRGTAWSGQRFEPERGRSGGEDTEFFFRLHAMGAVFAIADTAIVRETIPADRLSLRWLLRRRYRAGQSYAVSARSGGARLRLGALALAKFGFCVASIPLALPVTERCGFWLLRGVMHIGVCAGCLKLPQGQHYGLKTPAIPAIGRGEKRGKGHAEQTIL